MNYFSKTVDDALKPLIGSKCVFLDLPYYSNVGDVLIWEGMEQFILRNEIECLYRCSCQTFEYKQFDRDVCILLVGGGNFGDLWRGLQEFRNRIVSLYPHNRIIVFPQSVQYDSQDKLTIDKDVFAGHSDLFICARDEKSYHILKNNFVRNNILMLPDMALCLEYKKDTAANSKILFLKRDDQEAVDTFHFNTEEMTVSDWPMHTISESERSAFTHKYRLLHRIIRHSGACIPSERVMLWLYVVLSLALRGRLSDSRRSYRQRWAECFMEYEYLTYVSSRYALKLNKAIDYLMNQYHRPLIVKYGESYIAGFNTVYSTRLHAAIISAAMGKQTYFIDNSYGKISAVVDYWMKDFENIQRADLC